MTTLYRSFDCKLTKFEKLEERGANKKVPNYQISLQNETLLILKANFSKKPQKRNCVSNHKAAEFWLVFFRTLSEVRVFRELAPGRKDNNLTKIVEKSSVSNICLQEKPNEALHHPNGN